MKKFNPAKLLFGFLGLATFASLVGTVSGSLAWYAYSTRATLSYTGTSIEKADQLQVGICSPTRITTYTTKEMSEETYEGDNNYYYFAPVGNGLTSSLLTKYLDANGYATNYLIPATSGSYQDGDALHLKRSPIQEMHGNVRPSQKGDYAYFQFVFRIAKSTFSSTTEYLDGQEIWLKDATARASFAGNGSVYKSLRIFVDRTGTLSNYIFNPSAEQAGFTKVGGVLDLDNNGYFDYDGDGKEILYGDYDTTVNTDSKLSVDGYNDADEISDVNQSGATEADSFTAAHAQGIRYFTKEKLAECGIKTAQYKCLSDITPVSDGSGRLTNPDPDNPVSICKTAGNEDHYFARVNMTIYLEGWDFSVIDTELNHLFDIGLTFEINKVSNE